MKKLEDIAETDEEKIAIQTLVKEIRNFTSSALKGISVIEDSKKARPPKLSPKEIQSNLELQKNIYDSMFELFEKMHRIVDYPSFVILEDELKKSYQNKK